MNDEQRSVVPDPDPTELTTLQLRTTEAGLRTEIQALKDIIGARLDGMDEATHIQLVTALNYPSEIDKAIDQRTALHDKDIAAIHDLFNERNERFRESGAATDKALELAANLTEKQIDSLRLTHVSDKANINKDISALVSRLDRMESIALGLDKAAAATRQYVTFMISSLGVLLIFVGIIVSIVVTR